MTTPTTIVELRTSLLQVPWKGAAPAAGILAAPLRDIFVLEIETQGGLIGMSYLMPLRGGLHTLDACVKELIAPHVIGRDATEVEAIWQVLYKSNFWLGRMGVTVFAQSAVDMALWDIVGKRAGLPLFRLWGAARTEIPAYGSGCFRGLGRDGMIARAKEFTAQGLKAIKMQVAHIRPWREDVQNVKAMREAMGGGIEVMIDVNMGWDADTAIQAGHRIDEFDPYLARGAGDRRGLRRLPPHRGRAQDQVVGGESHFTRNDLRPFFETPCVPILQPDPMRGGYTELRKIAAAAEPWGIRIAPHLFHETMVHVLAAIPNASYLEYMDWNDDLWIEPVLPSKNGTMSPARAAGPWPGFPARNPEGLQEGRSAAQGLRSAGRLREHRAGLRNRRERLGERLGIDRPHGRGKGRILRQERLAHGVQAFELDVRQCPAGLDAVVRGAALRVGDGVEVDGDELRVAGDGPEIRSLLEQDLGHRAARSPGFAVDIVGHAAEAFGQQGTDPLGGAERRPVNRRADRCRQHGEGARGRLRVVQGGGRE